MVRLTRGERVPLLETKWRFVVLIGLAVFVALDIVLVVVAAQGVRPGPVTTPGPIPTFTSPATVGPSGVSPSASPTGPTAPATKAATTGGDSSGRSVLLSAVSATEAWRATPGTCSPGATSSAGVVEHTTDAGTTWKTIDLRDQALTGIVALDAGSSRTTVVGSRGATCALAAATTFTDGRFWAASPSDVGPAVYVASDSSLHLASGATAAPCPDPAQIIAGANATAVVCGDGLRVKPSAGSWVPVPMTGLVAIASAPGSFTFARTGVAGCSGLELETMATPVTASSTATRLGCAPLSGGAPQARQAALARAGSDVWLWADGVTRVSTDGGTTW